jgi:hypothetical protein
MATRCEKVARQIKQRVAGEPITDAAAVDASASNALIKKRLVILLPAEGNGGRLIVTAAGLAALARAQARRTVNTGGDAVVDKPDPHAPAVPRAEAEKPTVEEPADSALPPAPEVRLPKGKLGAMTALLQRPEGASVEDMMAVTGWQAHSVRGAMSGELKKKLGLIIESEKAAAGRVYRVTEGGARPH